MAHASAPSRSSGSYTISWGMVSIPVSIYTATEESGVKRSEYTESGHKIGRKLFDKETGDDLEYADIRKRVELPGGETVALSDEEIEQITSPVTGMAEIIEFVKVDRLSEYVAEKRYQVRPQKRQSGKNKVADPGASKAFALLLASMKAEKVFAVVQLTVRSTPRYATLTTDGVLTLVLFEDEVREPLPLPEADLAKAELDMGRKLVKAFIPEEPKALVDEASAKIWDYVKAKSKGEATLPETQTVQETQGDLLATLMASIEAGSAA